MSAWGLAPVLDLGACTASDVPEQAPVLAQEGAPTFEISTLPAAGQLSAFRPPFASYVNVFGVQIVATADVSERKLQHVARRKLRSLTTPTPVLLRHPSKPRAS